MTEVQKTWDNDMKDQVVSWIENEERCVTTQGICQELGISRNQASHLLQEILNAKQDCKVYSVSQQVNSDQASVQETVFQLGPSTLEQVQNGESATVFALAGSGTAELVSTAHERDMVQWRDALANSDDMVTQCPSFILPADDVLPLQHKKLERSLAPPTKTTSNSASSSSTIRKTPFSGATKVQKTTAASFFGKSKSTAPTSTVAATTTTSSSSLPKPVKEEPKQQKAKPPQPVHAKENTVQSINKPRAPSSNTAKVGSVDDFVGDVEDSDDEGPVQSSKARRKAAVEKAKRDVARDESVNEPNPADDDVDDEPVVRGAMDAFAVHKPAPAPVAAPSSGPRTQKRRKLVDKVVRVDGYLKTVTEYVWEEVPVEEEADKPKTSLGKNTSSSTITSSNKPKTKKPNPQAMKQKSLMGFFAKK